MDNLAHTLFGAALGQAGLKQRTRFGMSTLMIAANLPDIDALGLLVGENLAWRRGLTHGPLGLAILPLLLALAFLSFDRWQSRRGTRPAEALAVRFGWLLALAYIGILSHPVLDLLNTYGLRCLAPFSQRWFYGDTLFIIDPWVWSVLAIGVWLGRRRDKRAPAVFALLLMAGYTAAMNLAGRAAERDVARQVTAQGMGAPTRVLANPVPVNPFRRRIVFERGGAYGFGDYHWSPRPRFVAEPQVVPSNMADPAIALAAKHDKKVADFLFWSRYPFAEVRRGAGGIEVVVDDARYNSTPGDGRFSVRTVVPATGLEPVAP